MKRSVKVLLTIMISLIIISSFLVYLWSYPVVIMGGTEFAIGNVPGEQTTFEVIIPWPNTQILVRVEVWELVHLDVPGGLTGFSITNQGSQIYNLPLDEIGTYETGWLEAQISFNLTLRVYGYLANNRMIGRVTAWGRSTIHILFHGEFLAVIDKILQ